MLVTQQASPAMGITVGAGDLMIDTGNGYPHYGWDANSNVTISTADGSNPRYDMIVAYIDRSVVSSASSDNPGVLKFKAVTGTPAGSPVEPNAAAMQASVGASNYYCVLARVLVGAAVTTITNSNITDRRTFVNLALNDLLGGWRGVIDVLTYASASTFTVPGDRTAEFPVGAKLKLTQTTVKYFYVIASSFAAGVTTVTVTGGTDYTLANAAITLPYVSYGSSPEGFPSGFNYTVTWTGVTSTYTSVNRFWLEGRQCTVQINRLTNQASNSTSMTASLPIQARTVTNMAWRGFSGSTVDNNSSLGTPGLVEVASGATVMNLYKNADNGSLGNWTSSNAKGCNPMVTYEI